MSLLRPSMVVGAATVISRLLGFVRDVIIARMLGAGPVADAFLLALRLPNLMRRMLADGGINAGLVPLYLRIRRERGDEAALKFARDAVGLAAAALVTLIAVAELAAPLIVVALAPGYVGEPAIAALATLYTRLALPFVAISTLASVVAALLNAERRFAVAAFAPAAVNAALIGAFIAIERGVSDPAQAAAWLAAAFSLAGVLQLIMVGVAAARVPQRLATGWPRLTADIRRLARIGVPALAASGAAQLAILAATQVASATPSAVSWLHYADRVFQLPLSFVGVGASVVLLPVLTGAAAARGALTRALEAALALALPAAVALAVLAVPITSVLFERGAFGSDDTVGTAAALVGLSVGLPAGVAGKVLTQAFFARETIRVPLIAGALSILATLAVALGLTSPLGVAGIALGASVGLAVHVIVLGVALVAKDIWRPDARLFARLARFAGASLVMGLVVHGLSVVLADRLFGSGLLVKASALAGLCLAGVLIYALAACALGCISRSELKALVRRRR